MPTTVLVRRPSPRLTEGLVTHVARQPVDVGRALQQWHAYVETLSGLGWTIVDVPAADECPDSVFIEDTVVMFGDVAVVTRPGDVRRQPETAAIEPVVSGLGCTVARIEAPGTLDGGDVLKVGSVAYVGLGDRTNTDGIEQLHAIVSAHGFSVVAVPLTKVLHLKSAVTALPDGTIIGWRPAVDDPDLFPSFLAVPEEAGAHVVVIDEHRVLMADNAPETAALLRARGIEPITVDIAEFVKLEGCVTCLSVRLRR